MPANPHHPVGHAAFQTPSSSSQRAPHTLREQSPSPGTDIGTLRGEAAGGLCQHGRGGMIPSFLDLFGRAHLAHEFLMPAGKGHHQLLYHISLPNHSCFPGGVSGTPCRRQKKRGGGFFPAPTDRPWALRAPRNCSGPTSQLVESCNTSLGQTSWAGQGEGKASELEDKAISMEY